MSFSSRYQIERLLADGPAKTFQAIETATGQPVFLHIFNSEGRFLFDTIAARFRDSSGRPSSPLIETGEHAGSLFAVTEVLQPFVNLRAWVETYAPGMASPAPVKSAPGEFTRMFALQQNALPVEVPPVKEPGAFTLEFMAKTPPPAWPVPQPAVVAKPEPPKPSQPMWPERQPERAGDLSDLFDSLPPGEHVDVEAEQARAAGQLPKSKPFRPAGTFTKMFGAGSSRKSDAQMLESGLTTRSAITEAPNSKKANDPGEYTRMMAVPKEIAPPPAAQPIPVVAPAPANRAVIFAIVAIVVLTIAVFVLAALLYFKT